MKKTSDGVQVSESCWYLLLAFKDENPERFNELTGCEALQQLTQRQFWELYIHVSIELVPAEFRVDFDDLNLRTKADLVQAAHEASEGNDSAPLRTLLKKMGAMFRFPFYLNVENRPDVVAKS